MSTSDGLFSDRTIDYLDRINQKLRAMTPAQMARRVEELVADHDEWRLTCLNMMAAENVISRGARRLLDSDMATRLTEGFPGDKEFPPPRHNVHIDEIEAMVISLMKRLFRARFVEWRAVNTTMVNSAAFFALTDHGDTILVQSMEGGANMNYHPIAIPGIRGLNVVDMPPMREFEIDVEGVRKIAHEVKPKMLVVGGSYCIFSYPVRELREIADEVGAYLFYDAAHVGLFVAMGMFQDPLAEGAHMVSMSTHKTMSGPVGGALVTNDAEIAQRILRLTFPAFLQTRDENKYAAQAYVLAELMAYGHEYAQQIVRNAKALAAALEQEGFTVLGKSKGYTETHQVFVDLRQIGAPRFEALCQESGILVHKAHMMGDRERGVRTGSRIGVQEITRLGMKEAEMQQIAAFMRRVVFDGDNPSSISNAVREFLIPFRSPQYTFDQANDQEDAGRAALRGVAART